MTPDFAGEAVAGLIILAGLFAVLSVGCLVADYVLPHIPAVQRFLDTLPEWDDEDDED